MDIVSQIYNSLYKGRNDSTQAASASSVSQAAKSAEGRGISMAALNPGDIFLGEVTDVKGQDITIRISDGSQMHARLGEPIPVNIGDALRFMVRENSAEQLLLKALPNQERQQMSAVAERVLTANGFSLSEKNGNIAMALMNAGEPLDKSSIMKLLQQSYRFPEARLETLVSMNKLGLPVTEGNISQYESYINYSHQVSGTVNGMADTLVSAFADLAEGAEISQLLELNSQIMDVVYSGSETPMPEDGLEAFRQMMQTQLSEGEVNMSFTGVQEQTGETGLTPEPLPEGLAVQAGGTPPEMAMKTMEAMETTENTDGVQMKNPMQEQVITNPNLPLKESEFFSLSHALTKAGMPPEQTVSLLQSAASPEALLNQLSALMPNLRELDIRNLIKSSGYQKLLNDAVKSAWSIHPEKMKEPKEIDELYDRMQRDMQKLSASLEEKGAGGQEFGKQSGQMQQQLKFMQDINQNFIYAQMPVKLSENVTNSELYVYADKKKLAQKKDNISVLFHLDMEQLGPTDVYVSLNGKKVHAVFTFQDQKSVRIVASNISELEEKLEAKGLKLSHEVKKKPEVKKSPVVEEIIDPDAEKSVKRYNFDVRT